MLANDNDAIDQVLRKLGRLANLEQADREAIRSLPLRVETVPPDHFLVREGGVASECCILLEGYACRHKSTSNGGRQIVSFHMPGDILDLQHLLLSKADHNLQTITPATVGFVPAEELKQLAQQRPAVSEALWRDTLIDASIFREWVLNVGRRDGTSRVAHMLCEFAARREAAGLGPAESFELPMTQEQIADATGMTMVHVNRVVHELAAQGVIIWDQRQITITDWPRLRRIADFDPAYLHAAA
jgi:CRP-like cAMP-binding protein